MRVQQRRLAGVRVADQRDRGHRGPLALGTLHGAGALDVLEAPAQDGDPVAGQAAVGLDLGLAGAPRADPATEALEVASTALACAPGCIRAGRARPGACPRRCPRARRRCRGSPWFDRRPASRRPPPGCAPGGPSARRRRRSGSRRRPSRQPSLPRPCPARDRCWGAALRAAGASPRPPPHRRCAAARRAPEGRLPRRGRRRRTHADEPAVWALLHSAMPRWGRCDRCGLSPFPYQSRGNAGASPQRPRAPSRSTASSSRSSGVVSEIRNQPSPAGP